MTIESLYLDLAAESDFAVDVDVGVEIVVAVEDEAVAAVEDVYYVDVDIDVDVDAVHRPGASGAAVVHNGSELSAVVLAIALNYHVVHHDTELVTV